ncbi:Phenylalanine aminomutase (L-beta-phenylalanine forming), partial [Lamellibrachia satsuma]
TKTHAALAISSLEEYKQTEDCVVINGQGLTLAAIYAVANRQSTKVVIEQESVDLMQDNVDYLSGKIRDGMVIYGVNTGYGGSADVRSDDTVELQISLIRHLNAGFGPTFPSELVRAVMLVRANSLSLGFSGIRPTTVQLLVDMLNEDIVPVVPKRGSVSASGDLMPTSYIAACMMGRPDARVVVDGVETAAPAALERARLCPVEFQAKEALAIINAASFASSLGACVLFDANVAVLLTQVATALAVESLEGRVESFHPTIGRCMPHVGLREVASNLTTLLDGSRLAVQELTMEQKDETNRLKQDRYCLRSAPQWLAPVVETMQESVRRITTETNSANDNPLIDHANDAIVHCANFQGVSSTVAMDQARQALQLCGKLIFSQMEEIVNVTLSNGLPPNLAGGDYNVDFGFKGADTAMASYMAELDVLTNPVTNHVVLLSARKTNEALEVLQMMLANMLCCEMQAVDLRWLQRRVNSELDDLIRRHG